LLNEVGKRLPDDQRAALPEAMARYITADLEHVRNEILRNLCRSHVAERRECGIRALSPGLSGSLCVPTAMGSDDVVTFLGRWERSVRS
jgi:hypothetical protein